MKYGFLILFFLLNLHVRGQVGELLWEDNFNSEQLDLSKWNIETINYQ